jgi:hypothetical protein
MGWRFVPSDFTGNLPPGQTHPPSARLSVTDAELAEYTNAHALKPKPGTSGDDEF